MNENVVWLKDVGMSDVEKVGGKNASLGEMISGLDSQGVRVPGGFATTAEAFESFLEYSDLKNKINKLLSDLDVANIQELTKTGLLIRQWVEEAPFPDELYQSIVDSYEKLSNELGSDVTFAVRSSATAEDLPEASFAGQQETYLNVSGIQDIEILCATQTLDETKVFLDETLPSIVGIKSIAPAIASNVYKFETDWTPFANEA